MDTGLVWQMTLCHLTNLRFKNNTNNYSKYHQKTKLTFDITIPDFSVVEIHIHLGTHFRFNIIKLSVNFVRIQSSGLHYAHTLTHKLKFSANAKNSKNNNSQQATNTLIITCYLTAIRQFQLARNIRINSTAVTSHSVSLIPLYKTKLMRSNVCYGEQNATMSYSTASSATLNYKSLFTLVTICLHDSK